MIWNNINFWGDLERTNLLEERHDLAQGGVLGLKANDKRLIKVGLL